MTWADHALTAYLAVVSPLLAARSSARLARELAAGDPRARRRFYAWSVAEYWAVTLGLLALWRLAGRPFPALGVVAPAGIAAWVSAGLCLATVAFFVLQFRAALASDAARATVRAQLERQAGVRALLPETAAELKGFAAVGVTAGVCEELLYRGYLLWYLGALLPMGWAVVVAVVAFGLAHAYQGGRGVLSTGLAGGVALGVYLGTGSLLAPIVMHAVVDVANGYLAREVLGPPRRPPQAPERLERGFD